MDTRFDAEARRIAVWANNLRPMNLADADFVATVAKRVAQALRGAREDAFAEAAGRQSWAEIVGRRPYADIEEAAGGG
jgi:hypothetical protein